MRCCHGRNSNLHPFEPKRKLPSPRTSFQALEHKLLVQTNIPPEWDTGLRTERPFLYFCLMQQMLNVICPNSTWADRLEDLIENHFPKTTNGAFTSNDFGLIEGWKAKAPWRSGGRAKT